MSKNPKRNTKSQEQLGLQSSDSIITKPEATELLTSYKIICKN